MKPILTRCLDRILKTISTLMPARLMRHWLWLLRNNPRITDEWGFHVRPIHYYEPLPDFQRLSPGLCEHRRERPAIDFALQNQVALLSTLASECRAELDAIAQTESFDFKNSYFSGPDACAYYALIRHLQPLRVVEIGSGYSTRIASLALRQNEIKGSFGELTCIEPYPGRRLPDQSPRFTLIKKRVQDVPLAYFEALIKNDILMIDSSHVATIGSDVCYEFLDILPRLNSGVWVHVHDIFFPRDYPAEWVFEDRKAFNEQYLLEAFLSDNRSFTPKLAVHLLSLDHRSDVEALCPPAATSEVGINQLGSSFWMRKN